MAAPPETRAPNGHSRHGLTASFTSGTIRDGAGHGTLQGHQVIVRRGAVRGGGSIHRDALSTTLIPPRHAGLIHGSTT